MKQAVNVQNAAKPIGPYSHAVIANGFVFVSGQGPADPQTGEIPGNIHDQVRQTIENIRVILEGVGAGLKDVVKIQAFLADLDDFESYNAVYRRYFSEDYPARTTVGAQLLNILVEIDCVAVLPSTDQ